MTTVKCTEVWLDLFNNYSVSSEGNIKGKRGNLKSDNSSGYARVRLYKDGLSKSYLVHRIVAKAFIPEIDGLDQVNHINGDKLDNRVVNLEWSNQSLNQKHAYEIGLQIGYCKSRPLSDSHKAALCGSRWFGEVRRYLAEGMVFNTPEACADHFKISRQTVYNRVKSSRFPSWEIIVEKEVESD